MPKALCLFGIVVAILLLLVFGLDLALGVPFQGSSKIIDIGMVVCSLALGAVGFLTLREQK